ELARALRACGYTIVNAARGDFEIAEISYALCERFSKRHREIGEKTRVFLASHPDKQAGNEAALREHIGPTDRAPKPSDIGSERLRQLWFGQLSVEEADSLGQPGHKDRQVEQHVSAAEAVTWAENHLFERRSVVLEHELWRHALEAARGASVSLAEI